MPTFLVFWQSSVEPRLTMDVEMTMNSKGVSRCRVRILLACKMRARRLTRLQTGAPSWRPSNSRHASSTQSCTIQVQVYPTGMHFPKCTRTRTLRAQVCPTGAKRWACPRRCHPSNKSCCRIFRRSTAVQFSWFWCVLWWWFMPLSDAQTFRCPGVSGCLRTLANPLLPQWKTSGLMCRPILKRASSSNDRPSFLWMASRGRDAMASVSPRRASWTSWPAEPYFARQRGHMQDLLWMLSKLLCRISLSIWHMFAMQFLIFFETMMPCANRLFFEIVWFKKIIWMLFYVSKRSTHLLFF